MAACLANRKIRTSGVEIDRQKLALIRKGTIPFYEPKLQEILTRVLRVKRLIVTSNYEEALRNSDVTFVTVGTPSNPDGSVSLNRVKDAAAAIGACLKNRSGYHLVVIRSTVTPGTTEQVVKPLLESASGKSCGSDFGLCVNPEFLAEGQAVSGTMNPDRIIIGESDKEAGNALERFYTGLHGRQMPPLVRTTLTNGELIKYTNNAFLATKVSFINSIANLCECLAGADVEVIAKGIGLDPRIGRLFLKAGLGWGGSCFPKDVKALLRFAEDCGVDLPVVKAALAVNENQPLRGIELAKGLIGSLRGKVIAILGLSFKPETDDTREASPLKIIEGLLVEGAEVIVYDPRAMQKAKDSLGDKVRYADSASKCIEGADCCIIATEWNEFKKLTVGKFLKSMGMPAIVDGRRIFDPKNFKSSVKYAAVGLG
jgi:UDPglucose 6-dehydrogenase